MATITLKAIPRSLHRELKARAELHRRSLNSEIIACLEAAVGAKPVDADAFLAQVRELRGKVKGRLTDEALRSAKALGRP